MWQGFMNQTIPKPSKGCKLEIKIELCWQIGEQLKNNIFPVKILNCNIFVAKSQIYDVFVAKSQIYDIFVTICRET